VHYAEQGWEDLELYVKASRVYLNGKGPASLFDNTVDLTTIDWNYWGRNEWVLDRRTISSTNKY